MTAYGEFAPVGNTGFLTFGNPDFYTTSQEHAREFAYAFGMVNNKGASETTNLQDKVTLYLGHSLQAGGGDAWALNGVLELAPGAPAKNAQWAELDLNNNSMHYGNTAGAPGLASPSLYMLTLNGFSTYNATGGILFNQAGAGKLNRNIVFANGCLQSGIENYDSMTALIENNGAPHFVLRSRGTTSQMQVMGEVAFGAAPVSGVPLYVYRAGQALSILAGGSQATLRLQDAGAAVNQKYFDFDWDNGAFNWIVRNDDGSMRAAPIGLDTINMILRPVPDNAVELGYEGLRWKRVSSYRLSLRPPSSDTPANIGEMTIAMPSDTQLRFSVKGSDGVVRSAVLTLA